MFPVVSIPTVNAKQLFNLIDFYYSWHQQTEIYEFFINYQNKKKDTTTSDSSVQMAHNWKICGIKKQFMKSLFLVVAIENSFYEVFYSFF